MTHRNARLRSRLRSERLIGGTITLPQFKVVSVTLGDGGDGDGLKIFTSTGHRELDGSKIVIPEIVAGPIELDAVTVGFSEKDTRNWDLLVGGTIVLFKEGTFQRTRITVKLQLGEQDGNSIVEGFAVDLRGLEPRDPDPRHPGGAPPISGSTPITSTRATFRSTPLSARRSARA